MDDRTDPRVTRSAGVSFIRPGDEQVDNEGRDQHLSQILTHWSVVFQAHQGPASQVAEAQRQLMERYGGAVHRYLLGLLRDPDAADELAQEFAVRFLRGDFKNVEPGRGRFRDFVKQALRNLTIDYWRRRARPREGIEDSPEPSAPDPGLRDFEHQFLVSWRDGLMDRAWRGLALHQEQTGQPYHTVLLYRAEHPEQHSPEMAEHLSSRLGRPVNASWVRQSLLLAREKFVELLLEEVGASLREPTADHLEEELADLGLLEYCRGGLRRH
jgi:DNA-directed RNA polymerase specialized sigma24 family protein